MKEILLRLRDHVDIDSKRYCQFSVAAPEEQANDICHATGSTSRQQLILY